MPKWDDPKVQQLLREGYTPAAIKDLLAVGPGVIPVHTSGTVNQLPPNGSLPDGSTFLATDQNGGTLYRMTSGVWAQAAPGVNAANGYELAYSENATTTASVIAPGANGDIAGVLLTVPVSARPVWLKVGISVNQQATPAAATVKTPNVVIYETTGARTPFKVFDIPMQATAGQVDARNFECRLGPTVAVRTFVLNIINPAGGGNVLAQNGNSGKHNTFLAAVAL